MKDISGVGLQIHFIASQTMPIGFTLSQFADDADPFDIPSLKIKETSMGLNGDLLGWAKAAPIPITIALVPGGSDDINLSIVFEANRVGRGKLSAQDVITMVGIYPDGSTITLTEGFITDGMPGNGVASAGRLKTKVYGFSFENVANI